MYKTTILCVYSEMGVREVLCFQFCSLGTGIFFEVIEAILIDRLNSVGYTENRYSAQLYFH